MNDERVAISLPLRRVDALTLQQVLGEDSVSVQSSLAKGAIHGEPVSTALIVVSVASVGALASWLASRRVIKFEMSRKSPDGSEETLKFDFEQTPEAGLVATILKALKQALFPNARD